MTNTAVRFPLGSIQILHNEGETPAIKNARNQWRLLQIILSQVKYTYFKNSAQIFQKS